MEQSEGLIALFIPLFAIVFGVAVAIVSIVTSHRQKVKRAELRHRERIAAIEKGMDPPQEPLDFEVGRKGASLRSGLVGLFVGIVLYFALRAVADEDVALFGLIPAAVGIANLIAWFVESKKNGNGHGLKRDG